MLNSLSIRKKPLSEPYCYYNIFDITKSDFLLVAGNHALGKTTQQSSVLEDNENFAASKAVDGCVETGLRGDCGCIHTQYERRTTLVHWWAVDLESAIRIRRVRILNRGDCCCKVLLYCSLYKDLSVRMNYFQNK